MSCPPPSLLCRHLASAAKGIAFLFVCAFFLSTTIVLAEDDGAARKEEGKVSKKLVGRSGKEFSSPLETFDELYDAYAESDSQGWPVDVTGTLVLYDPQRLYCFIQVDDRSTYVWFPSGTWPTYKDIRPGDSVRVVGVLDDSAQAIQASSMAIVGHKGVPEPVKKTLSQLNLGDRWGQWTVQQGIVKQVVRLRTATYLGLEWDGAYFTARIAHAIPIVKAKSLIGARVQLKGALLCDKEKGVLERFVIYMMKEDAVEVVEKASSLRKFKEIRLDKLNSHQDEDVFFTATIAHVNRYHRILVEQDTSSVTVENPLTEWLYNEQVMEIYGRSTGSNTVDGAILIETSRRKLGPAETMTAKEFVQRDCPMHRVKMTGNVIDTVSRGTVRVIHLQDDGVNFQIRFEADDDTFDALDLDEAQRVLFSGCAMKLGDNRRDEQFRVLMAYGDKPAVTALRSEVLRRRVYTMLLALVVGGGVAIGWILLLRLQVKARTRELARETDRLKASFDSVNEGILLMEFTRGKSRCNQRFLEMFDLDEAPSDTEAFLQTVGRRIDPGENFESWCNTFSVSTNASGRRDFKAAGPNQRWVCVFTAPVEQGNGRETTDAPRARIWTVDDVTERRLLENQLRESQKMEAVGRLADGVAHDFNNILATLSTNLEVMQLQPDRTIQEYKEQFAASEQSIQHATILIRSLLEYSRNMELDRTVLDIKDLVSETEHLIRSAIGAAIELQIALKDDHSAKEYFVEGDKTRLKQVLVNLCLNARDATEGKGSITVSAMPVKDDNRNYVEIRVTDDGCGIPAEQLDRIFDPFFTTKNAGEGTGLGLSMSFGIISQHGGTLTVTSNVGKGSEFVIRLPCAHEMLNFNQTTLDEPHVQETNGSETAMPLISCNGSPRVLLADDETNLRKAISLVLKRTGYVVDEAQNGEEVLEMIGDEPESKYGIVLMDLTMPKMSGLEALRKIRVSHPHLPVILLSGRILPDVFEDESCRPNAVFMKPIKSRKLIDAIRQFIETPAES